MWHRLIALAVAGACGTLLRYGLAGAVQRGQNSSFPWGTLAVNVAGCFLFGLVWALAQQRLTISSEVRTVILVGFLGSFTTFSSFVFETSRMLEQSEWFLAGLNLAAELGLGWSAFLLGVFLGRLI